MSFADCVARISQLDSLMRSVDPSWATSGRSMISNSVQGLNSGSPFAGVMESLSTPATSTAAPAATITPLFVGEQPVPGTLMSPSSSNPAALTQQSGATVLARFDSISSKIAYGPQIRAAAIANGIDPLLLASLVYAESNFDPKAVSSCGAQGLTQLMPATARELGVTNSFDPQQNLNGGAKYIATQLRNFGRVDLALAAYNAGPGAIARLGVVPDSKRGYVNAILGRWTRYVEAAA